MQIRCPATVVEYLTGWTRHNQKEYYVTTASEDHIQFTMYFNRFDLNSFSATDNIRSVYSHRVLIKESRVRAYDELKFYCETEDPPTAELLLKFLANTLE